MTTVARFHSISGLSRACRSLRTISGSTTLETELRTVTTTGSPKRPIEYWASAAGPSSRATATLLRLLFSMARKEAAPEGMQKRNWSRQGSASGGS